MRPIVALYSRRAILLTGSALAAGLVGACSSAPAPGAVASSYSGGARLQVDNKTIDAGNVAFRQEVKAVYRLTNIGDRALVLGSVTIDTIEGCWPPSPVVGATTIEPGQSTELVVKFTMSETMGGPHRFDVTVKSNDPVEPTQVVTVKARFP